MMHNPRHFQRRCAELAMQLPFAESGTEWAAYALAFLAEVSHEDTENRWGLDSLDERHRLLTEAEKCRTKEAVNNLLGPIRARMGRPVH
jgi:hypothetical protein